MLSKKSFAFILAMFMLSSCDDDGPLQIKVGSIQLQLNELGNQPSQINVTLQPGDRKLTFGHSSQLMLIEDLDEGLYDIVVEALNANGGETHQGSSKDVLVQANKETFVSIDMESLMPGTPTGLTVSQTSMRDIKLRWNSTERASGYNLYRLISGSSEYRRVKNSSSTFWNDNGVQIAQWYHYKISAYSNAGESLLSNSVSGYRKGWRFEDDISFYDPDDAIGFNYHLRAYGFKGVTTTIALYAAYKDSSNYYFVPGCGKFGFAAYTFDLTPPYDETHWTGRVFIYDSCWNSNYRNNRYPQYIQMRVYTSNNISSLNANFYTQTSFYKIEWTSNNAANRQQAIIVSKLSDNESALINRMVMRNPSINYSEKSTSHHFGSNKEKRVVRALSPMILNEGLQKVSH